MKAITVNVTTGESVESEYTGLVLTQEQALARDAEDRVASAKAERNRLLAACDWTILPDSPLDGLTRESWLAYRQALRDLPRQPGFPAVDWPVAP